MSGLRVGRASVRFVRCYQTARVSYGNASTSLQLSTVRQSRPSGLSYAIVRTYADKPVGRPKQHTGRAPARKSRATGSSTKTKTIDTDTDNTKEARLSGTVKKRFKKAKKPAKKPEKKVKPPLTEEQLARKKQKLQLEKIRDLKRRSMKTEMPPKGPNSAYQVLQAEFLKGYFVSGKEGIADAAREVSAKYKNLSAGEREHYNHIANQNKAAAEEATKKWVLSLPASKIKDANDARRNLTKLGIKNYTAKIPDPRTVARPGNPYSLFLKERYASADFAGINFKDSAKQIGAEWLSLPESEKQKFVQLFAQARERWASEYRTVYGRDPPSTRTAKALGTNS